MKIVSLNVHQFEESSWQKKIIAVVKQFLLMEPDGVVFLYEIPGRYYKTRELEALFGPYYQIKYSGRGAFFTIAIHAIQKKNGGWSPLNDFSHGKDYKNRYMELRSEQCELRVLGVHAPLEKREEPKYNEAVKTFFDKLYEYAKTHCKEKTIILGDMNVHSGMPCDYYNTFHSIRTEAGKGGLGYTDLVKDGTITYFPNGHTLDHALVSPELKDKVTAKVYAQKELELSDHAVIVIDIQIEDPTSRP